MQHTKAMMDEMEAMDSTPVSLSSYASMYAKGFEFITQAMKVQLIPDAACKSTCFHRLRKKSDLAPIPGITWPNGFSISRPATTEEFDELQAEWLHCCDDKELESDVVKFWSPLFKPQNMNSSSELELYTLQKLQIQSAYDAQYGGAIHNVGISLNPSKAHAKGLYPEAFIPERGWFDKAFEEIEIKDILTLFAEPEQELLAICFGRAVAGRPNHLPIGDDKPLRHAFRTFPVIFGAEPGQGKSIFANALINAMKLVGYRVANFKTMATRFNLGSVISAHVAYRDDCTSDALGALLKADDTKQAITNAQIRVEDKGTNAIEIWSNAFFFTNVNRWNPQIVYSLDDGIMDRVKLVSTLYNVELAKIVPIGASEGTPSIYPYHHLQYLADKYCTTVDGIMLWFLRLCLDKFMDLLKAESNGKLNAMELEIKRLSNRLRCQFNSDITKSITSCLMLCTILRNPSPTSVHIPELTSSSLAKTLKAMHFVALDKRAHHVRSLIKEDWDDKDRPEAHPWKAISRLKASSIDLALTNFIEELAIAKNDIGRLVKTVFTALSLKDGFNVGSGIVYITSAWEESRMHINDFKELAISIQANARVDKEALISFAKADVEHLYEFTYDSEKLAKELG